MSRSLSTLHAEPAVRRAAPLRLERHRHELADGRATTLHVLRVDRQRARSRVVALPRPRRLLEWCRADAVGHAIIGGFFVRPEGTPLGELLIAGKPLRTVPFDPPWDAIRACVALDGPEVRITRRPHLDRAPRGDMLQAGPLLVAGGADLVTAECDLEGFSAGSHQFDSDITRGRYPRAALGLAGDELLAVVCDGRCAEEAGLTLSELARAMIGLGAERAINLDGGGSASLVAGGHLVNRPREEHGLEILGGRHVATAIAFELA